MAVGSRAAAWCVAVLALAVAASGCADHRGARGATPRIEVHRAGSLLACLRDAGADAADVSRDPDLRVSGGELSLSFASFNGYVGLATDAHEAAAAAGRFDAEVQVLQEPGRAAVHRRAVYYFDAPDVPPAAGRLVRACLDGSDIAATAALRALAGALPSVELPAALQRAFLVRCRAVAGVAPCACAYARATRLLGYVQVLDLGTRWSQRRALVLIEGLLRTCPRPVEQLVAVAAAPGRRGAWHPSEPAR